MPTEQWVVTTRMEGEPPNDMVGPFTSKADAQTWMNGNEVYLDLMVQEAIELWTLNHGRGEYPDIEQEICYLNHPSRVGPSKENRRQNAES